MATAGPECPCNKTLFVMAGTPELVRNTTQLRASTCLHTLNHGVNLQRDGGHRSCTAPAHVLSNCQPLHFEWLVVGLLAV